MSWGTLWEVRYHFPDNLDRQYVKNLRTSDSEEDAIEFLKKLIREEGRSVVVLRTIEKVPPVRFVEKSCGFCGQTRQEPVRPEGKVLPPGTLTKDSHLWRELLCS